MHTFTVDQRYSSEPREDVSGMLFPSAWCPSRNTVIEFGKLENNGGVLICYAEDDEHIAYEANVPSNDVLATINKHPHGELQGVETLQLRNGVVVNNIYYE